MLDWMLHQWQQGGRLVLRRLPSGTKRNRLLHTSFLLIILLSLSLSLSLWLGSAGPTINE